MVETWLSTDFGGGRHERRVNKIKAIEDGGDPREVADS
jgi:ribose 5-phosphate isomerase RpiB